MEHLQLGGAPREVGLAHGRRLSALIPEVLRRCCPVRPEDAAAVREAARAVEPALLEACPDLPEEMRGIALGAGLPYEDIFLLNAFFDAQGDALHRAAHCTAIGLPNTGEGPLVAKTDDVEVEERGFETFFHIRPQRGHEMMYYAYGGTAWNQGGLNAAGLALAMTGLPPAGPSHAGGVPSLLFLREVLQRCAGVEEALAFAEAHPLRSHGCVMTLADAASGEVAVVENYPSRRAVRHSSQRPTVNTNHPQCEATIALAPDPAWRARFDPSDLIANSQARFHNASRLVNEIPRSVAGLKQLLADHTQPGGICQHGAAGLHTSIAMILIPRERAMVAAEGYGCGPYAEFAL